MATINHFRPDPATIGQIAERQPKLLNVLLAYFVFEWRDVRFRSDPPVGTDQAGVVRVIPDYVRTWGVDRAVHYLLRAPLARRPEDPGFVSRWIREILGAG